MTTDRPILFVPGLKKDTFHDHSTHSPRTTCFAVAVKLCSVPEAYPDVHKAAAVAADASSDGMVR